MIRATEQSLALSSAWIAAKMHKESLTATPFMPMIPMMAMKPSGSPVSQSAIRLKPTEVKAIKQTKNASRNEFVEKTKVATNAVPKITAYANRFPIAVSCSPAAPLYLISYPSGN